MAKSSNFFSSIVSALSSATGSASSTVSSALSSVFASKTSAATTTFQALQNLGPGADAGELGAMMTQVTNQLGEISAVPQVEFAFVSELRALIGKTDPASVASWETTCAQATAALQNASSSWL